jgi:hypothetical protein
MERVGGMRVSWNLGICRLGISILAFFRAIDMKLKFTLNI